MAGGQLVITTGTAPGTPSAGKVSIYAKTDNFLYIKDDTGTETAIGASVADLDDLSDVAITTPTTGDVLTFDGSEWVNQAPAGGGVWGDITGTLSDQTDLQSALDSKVQFVLNQTTSTYNDTPTVLFSITSTVSYRTYKALITAWNTNSEETKYWEYTFSCRYDGTDNIIVGNPLVHVSYDSGASGYEVELQTSGSNINFEVIGDSSFEVSWNCKVY